MSKSSYEFKSIQKDGVEIVMRVADSDVSLPEIVENLISFFRAAGFHESTIGKCLLSEEEA